MSKRMMIGVLAILMAVGGVYAGTTTEDVSVLIIPIVTEGLTATPTWYNFGAVNVQTSSNSATSLTLTNTGSCGITVEKSVESDDAWDITAASTTTDGFGLWVATSAVAVAARPAMGDYTDLDAGGDYIKALTTYSNLTGVSNTDQTTLDPEDATGLWFRIDMPKYVTTTDQQSIVVRLQATGN